MDEPTHEKSPLRFVNSPKPINNSKNPINPREIRRQKLRIEQRNNQLVALWRLFLYGSISSGLGYIFVINAWSPINENKIQIKGSNSINPKSIINASNINFPLPLLYINPQEFQSILLKALPINSISIRRQIIPPGIEIELREMELIALANRRSSKGLEKGMVDINGKWIPLAMANQISPPQKKIYIEGWRENNRQIISEILKSRNRLGSPLEKITFNPNGEVTLKTKTFERIHLGTNKALLKKQIQAIGYLTRKLPLNLYNQSATSIDLRDPSRPELQISK